MPPQTIEAVYENGVLRPLRPLQGIAENDRVTVTVTTTGGAGSLQACVGTLPDADAREMRAIIESEFEQVEPDDWR